MLKTFLLTIFPVFIEKKRNPAQISQHGAGAHAGNLQPGNINGVNSFGNIDANGAIYEDNIFT